MNRRIKIQENVRTANEVAEYIIYSCNKKAKPITNLKLQKLLYYVQGYSYALGHRPMFGDPIEAWSHGPVVPDVYKNYCASGAAELFVLPGDVNPERLSAGDQAIVDRVIDDKADIYVWELVAETQNETPWKVTYNLFGDKAEMSQTLIEKHFEHDSIS